MSNRANLAGFILQDSEDGQPWLNPVLNRIKTTIENTEKENIFPIELSKEWNTEGPENYSFLEFVDFSKGFRFLAEPISPTPKSNDFFSTGVMESLFLTPGNASIAEYKLA